MCIILINDIVSLKRRKFVKVIFYILYFTDNYDSKLQQKLKLFYLK